MKVHQTVVHHSHPYHVLISVSTLATHAEHLAGVTHMVEGEALMCPVFRRIYHIFGTHIKCCLLTWFSYLRVKTAHQMKNLCPAYKRTLLSIPSQPSLHHIHYRLKVPTFFFVFFRKKYSLPLKIFQIG